MSSIKTKCSLFIFVFTLLFLGFQRAHAHNFESFARQFESYLDQKYHQLNVPGAAIAVVSSKKVLFQKTYGVCQKGRPSPYNEQTLNPLASLSKGMTGILVAKMAQKNYLSLNDPIHQYCPSIVVADREHTSKLAIYHLLGQCSGIQPYSYENIAYIKLPIHRMWAHLRKAPKRGSIGKQFYYQNVLFSLLGPILKNATTIPFKDLLRKELFDPLEMNNTLLSHSEVEEYPNVAHPHRRGVVLSKKDYLENTLPAAGVRSTISDMSIWLQALLGGRPEVLSHQLLEDAFTPITKIPVRNIVKHSGPVLAKRIRASHYAMGWYVHDYQGHEIIYHGGLLTGYTTSIGFSRKQDIGIIILTNDSGNGGRLKSLTTTRFFDFLFEIEPFDYLSAYPVKKR